MNNISNQILNYNYLSYYNDNLFNLIINYRPRPLVCKLIENKKIPIRGVDICKAYTYQLLNIKKIPIFTIFNYPKKYDNKPINDYYMYLIEIKFNSCIFKEKYTLIYGYNLKQLDKNLYKII